MSDKGDDRIAELASLLAQERRRNRELRDAIKRMRFSRIAANYMNHIDEEGEK